MGRKGCALRALLSLEIFLYADSSLLNTVLDREENNEGNGNEAADGAHDYAN